MTETARVICLMPGTARVNIYDFLTITAAEIVFSGSFKLPTARALGGWACQRPEMCWTGLELGSGVMESVSGLLSAFNTDSLCSYNNIECNHISAVALKFKGAVERNRSHTVRISLWSVGH